MVVSTRQSPRESAGLLGCGSNSRRYPPCFSHDWKNVERAVTSAFPDRSWLEGAVGALLGVLVAFAIILYRTYLRQSLGRLRRMKTAAGHILVTDETLTVSTDLGSGTLPWSSFVGMSEHPGFWQTRISPRRSVMDPHPPSLNRIVSRHWMVANL
jgi:hypothetical protein